MSKIRNCAVYFDRFKAYHAKNSAWGCLHVVLDDGNVEDSKVRFCRRWAMEQYDFEAAALADLLLQMSEYQRLRIMREC